LLNIKYYLEKNGRCVLVQDFYAVQAMRKAIFGAKWWFLRRYSNHFNGSFIPRQRVWPPNLHSGVGGLFYFFSTSLRFTIFSRLTLQFIKAAFHIVFPIDLVNFILIVIYFILNNL
jgi:hypothetical protein